MHLMDVQSGQLYLLVSHSFLSFIKLRGLLSLFVLRSTRPPFSKLSE
jgi:hypothetical protein